VFSALDEPIDCNGVEGATIEITDADAQVVTLTSNAAGNFFLGAGQSTLVFPITAKVIVGDTENAMASAQSSGACNSCHTDAGTGGAPGRITGG
jgi:hypothetical protein